MSDYMILAYNGGTPGADSATYLLFDSSLAFSEQQAGRPPLIDYMRYRLSLKNSQPGVLVFSGSPNRGKTWFPVYQIPITAATATANNEIAIPTEPHSDVKVEWTNGGSAQATWYVAQGLDNGQPQSRPSFFDTAGDVDPGANTTVVYPASSLGQRNKAGSLSVTLASDQLGTQVKAASLSITPATDQLGQTTKAASFPVVLASDDHEKGVFSAGSAASAAEAANEIPLVQYLAAAPTLTDTQVRSLLVDVSGNLKVALSVLGQKTTANSQSVGFSSDSPEHYQASMRAPMRGEVLNIPVTLASVTFDIPDATIGGQPDYRGKLVDCYADGTDVYLQFSASTTAAADETAQSVVASSSGGRFSVAPNATPSEVFPIPRGQWRPIQFPATGSFALKAASTGVVGRLRTMLSQT